MPDLSETLERYWSRSAQLLGGVVKDRWPFYWERTWYAPCDSLAEFRRLQVVAPDRLQIVVAPGGQGGSALRAEVRNGDQPPNVGGGWRAEVVGPIEQNSITLTKFRWRTFFDAAYPRNPVAADPSLPAGPAKPIWQVFFQWHQADDPDPDYGSSPPVAFIIEPGPDQQGALYVHLHRSDLNDPSSSVETAKLPVATLQPATWHEFEAEIMWNINKGSIRVFHNGQEVVPRTAAQTIFPKRTNPNLAGSSYLKAGLYRKPWPATDGGQAVGAPPNVGFIVYHDEIERFERRLWPGAWLTLLLQYIRLSTAPRDRDPQEPAAPRPPFVRVTAHSQTAARQATRQWRSAELRALRITVDPDTAAPRASQLGDPLTDPLSLPDCMRAPQRFPAASRSGRAPSVRVGPRLASLLAERGTLPGRAG